VKVHGEGRPLPAIPACLLEPIWEQVNALLPERHVEHPLGCHQPREPDRVTFNRLVLVLVFGRAYRGLADRTCSATRRSGAAKSGSPPG